MGEDITQPGVEPLGKDPLLKIGQVAELSGKTVRAIHFYEELGLLVPAQRTKGGFRLYDPDALLRIQWIDRLQDLGFSLPEIRDFLSNLRGDASGPAAMHRLRQFYAEKLKETRIKLESLQRLEGELQESLTYLAGCRACAPSTARTACRSCEDTSHSGHEPPALVAAVQSSV